MTKMTLQNESITEYPFDPAELTRRGVVVMGEGTIEVVTPNSRIPLRFRFRRTRNLDHKARRLHMISGPSTDLYPSEYRKARKWADDNLPR